MGNLVLLTKLEDLSEHDLIEIQDHAHDLMTWKDIAYLMKIDINAFKRAIDNPRSPVHYAYNLGRVERKKKLRAPILKLAEIGSPQAEMLADKFLEDQELSDNHE